MTKKIVFTTGANKGIGYEVARQLAAQEFIVLLGARDDQRGAAAAQKLSAEGEVHFVPIDVTDEQAIAAAAEIVSKQWGKVDILINNTGISEYAAGIQPSDVESNLFKKTFETNTIGAFTVIHLCEAGKMLILTFIPRRTN